MKKYNVITLCGSTRFEREYYELNRDLTLAGNVVFSCGVFKGPSGESDEVKVLLDDIHKQKIDMSDEIFVINKGGYIGESTRSEIEYAKKNNKKITYLCPNEFIIVGVPADF